MVDGSKRSGTDLPARLAGLSGGQKPDYPEEALRKDLDQVRRMVDEMKKDPTTPDSRLADWVLLGFPQTATEAMMNLMLGGYSYNKLIWPLHSRVRYFDPVRRRAGSSR